VQNRPGLLGQNEKNRPVKRGVQVARNDLPSPMTRMTILSNLKSKNWTTVKLTKKLPKRGGDVRGIAKGEPKMVLEARGGAVGARRKQKSMSMSMSTAKLSTPKVRPPMGTLMMLTGRSGNVVAVVEEDADATDLTAIKMKPCRWMMKSKHPTMVSGPVFSKTN
jgi:hypothetical protein